MENNIERFKKLYRRRMNINDTTQEEIKAFIEKLTLCVTGVKAGIDVQVMKRHTGLTDQEIIDIPKKAPKIIEEYEKKHKYASKSPKLTNDRIRQSLLANKEYIIERLLLGDKMGEICRDLGVSNRTTVVKSFLNSLTVEGYFVNKVTDYHKISRDIMDGVPVEDIIEDYGYFVNENAVRDFMDKHGIGHLELVNRKQVITIK